MDYFIFIQNFNQIGRIPFIKFCEQDGNLSEVRVVVRISLQFGRAQRFVTYRETLGEFGPHMK